MSVTLREKSTSKGVSLYLDIYINYKRRREYLNLYLVGNKKLDKETRELAEEICVRKRMEIAAGNYNITVEWKKRTDLCTLFANYKHQRHYSVYKACLQKLKTFTGREIIPCSIIDENFCIRFKKVLITELNYGSPFNYFKVFKRVLKDATTEGCYTVSPCEKVPCPPPMKGSRKNPVLASEVLKLYSTPCNNKEVARAFLFAMQTGMRLVDIRRLKKSDVDHERNEIKICQNKTKVFVTCPLNDNAMDIIKTTNREYLFHLPSTINGVNKIIKQWYTKAKIKRHLTFGCCRHGFVSQIVESTGNLKLASTLAGHTTTRHTESYTHVNDKAKREAVDSLKRLGNS